MVTIQSNSQGKLGIEQGCFESILSISDIGQLRQTFEEVPAQKEDQPKICRVQPFSGSRITPVTRPQTSPIPGPSSYVNPFYKPETEPLSC